MQSGSASAAAAAAAASAARTAAAGGRAADIAAALAAAGARGRAAHRAAGAGSAVEAEAAFAARAVAVAADGAVRLTAGIAAGLADERGESDTAEEAAGITHKNVPSKKKSYPPTWAGMTSYDMERLIVRLRGRIPDAGAHGVAGIGRRAAHDRKLGIAQLVRRVGLFVFLHRITPRTVCVRRGEIIQLRIPATLPTRASARRSPESGL